MLVGLAIILQSWLMRVRRVWEYFRRVVLNAVVTIVVQLAGGVSGHGIWLIIGSIAGQAAAANILRLEHRVCS